MEAVSRDSERAPAKGIHLILPGIVALAAWAGFCWKMSVDWSTNAQYEFGFFVPFFAGHLLWRRWSDRPEAGPVPFPALIAAALGALLLAMLPLRVIVEANPDWRPLNWAYAAVLVALTLGTAGLAGGPGWAKHFVWPLALIFFAIPWPLAMEQGAIQALSRVVTGVTTELLNLFGVPALQKGNTIETTGGVVGVNDACSGIRSLAGSLMAGFYLGEFFRLRWTRRIFLLVAGVSAALVLNLVRALILAGVTASGGKESWALWHDPAGLAIFAVSFAFLWFLASRMEEAGSKPARQRPTRIGIPTWALVGALAWLGVVELATEAWYRMREQGVHETAGWTFRWPGAGRVRATPIQDEVRAILRYTHAESGRLDEPGAPPWQVFYGEWAPGRSSAQLAVMHRPEICLPSQGLKPVGARELLPVHAGGLELPFESTVFEQEGERIYVFRTLWQEKVAGGAGAARSFDLSMSGRLRSAWHGRRSLGQKLLLISVLGASSEEEARRDLQARLPGLIHVATVP